MLDSKFLLLKFYWLVGFKHLEPLLKTSQLKFPKPLFHAEIEKWVFSQTLNKFIEETMNL